MLPNAFQCLQIAFTLSLAFLAGLSSCFTLWVVPLLQLSRVPAQAKTAEFAHLFTLGGRYLQPSSRALTAMALGLGMWSYSQGDGVWKYYIVMVGILVPVAVWEVVMIFPINDRVEEMDRRLQKDSGALSADEESELREVLDRWSRRHIMRWMLPAVASAVSAVAVLQ